jgi:carbon-monoxide dehydrogenase medium subunit
MIPPKFEYVAPGTLEEAMKVLSANPGAKILAGGHSLIPDMKLHRAAPAMLVDISKIAGLKGISREADGSYKIGALTTHAEVAADAELSKSHPVMSEALYQLGDVQVRNRGTIGGNIAMGAQAYDIPAVAMALDAQINTIGPNGSRSVAADQFTFGLHQTVLGTGEIITSISIPGSENARGSSYEKFRNPAYGSAIVGIAAQVTRTPDGKVESCRVAVTGATAIPRRLRSVEKALEGKIPDKRSIAAAAQAASEGLETVTDLFASGEYRAHLVKVLTERALGRAVERSIVPNSVSGTTGSKAYLIVQQGQNVGQRYNLKEGTTTIGRSPESDIRLEESYIARHHAVIKQQGEAFTLIDLGSELPTQVEGKALEPGEPVVLMPRAIITLGMIAFRFNISS